MNDLYNIYKEVLKLANKRNYDYEKGWSVPFSDVEQLQAFIRGIILTKESNKENKDGTENQ